MSSDSVFDITTETASYRITDDYFQFNGDVNIDDYSAEFLKNGAISQRNDTEVYSGIRVIGSVANPIYDDANAEDKGVVISHWSGNIDIPFHRFVTNRYEHTTYSGLIKSKSAGYQMDSTEVTSMRPVTFDMDLYHRKRISMYSKECHVKNSFTTPLYKGVTVIPVSI